MPKEGSFNFPTLLIRVHFNLQTPLSYSPSSKTKLGGTLEAAAAITLAPRCRYTSKSEFLYREVTLPNPLTCQCRYQEQQMWLVCGNSTQARVIREEGASVEEMPP